MMRRCALYTTRTLIVVAAFVGTFAAAAEQPQGCLTFDRAFFSEIDQSVALAEDWLVNNQRKNGLFLYRYNPDTGATPKKNNTIRQLMASRVLARLASAQPKLLRKHQLNLAFVFNRWFRVDKNKRGYIYYSGKSKLGANALALRTLVASPMFGAYRQQATELANGIESMIADDGSMRAWFRKPDYDFDEDYLLKFYSGEAILALLEYASKTGESRILELARRAQRYYLQRYVSQIDAHYYPAYVPWHTFALHHDFAINRDKALASAVFVLNDRLLKQLDHKTHIGRFYNPSTPQYGNPHAASDGVYTESLVHAYMLASELGDDERAQRYKAAIEIAVRYLIKLQFREQDKRVVSDRKRVLGAIRTDVKNRWIRLDNVQHALDALHKIQQLRCR